MFTIIWDFNGFINNRMSFEDRQEANEYWQLLKEAGATNMRAEKPQTKRFVVKVRFSAHSKAYTYLTREKISVGTQVIVRTSDGPQIVVVVDSGEMSDSELAKICPLSQFKYIEGRVVAA